MELNAADQVEAMQNDVIAGMERDEAMWLRSARAWVRHICLTMALILSSVALIRLIFSRKVNSVTEIAVVVHIAAIVMNLYALHTSVRGYWAARKFARSLRGAITHVETERDRVVAALRGEP